MEEWLKSVLNYRSYPKNKTGYPFLDHHVYTPIVMVSKMLSALHVRPSLTKSIYTVFHGTGRLLDLIHPILKTIFKLHENRTRHMEIVF